MAWIDGQALSPSLGRCSRMAKAYGRCELCGTMRFLNYAGFCKKCGRTKASAAHAREAIAEQKALHEQEEKEKARLAALEAQRAAEAAASGEDEEADEGEEGEGEAEGEGGEEAAEGDTPDES